MVHNNNIMVVREEVFFVKLLINVVSCRNLGRSENCII